MSNYSELHSYILKSLSNFLLPKLYLQHKNIFYKKIGTVILLIKYRKHLKVDSEFFIEYGSYYLELEKHSVPPPEKKWHLFGNLGVLDPSYKIVDLDRIDGDIDFFCWELIQAIELNVFPVLDKVANIKYMKDAFPSNFDLRVCQPMGLENLKKLERYFQSK